MILIASGVVVLIALISVINLYADIQRIGCESAGQLMGPTSKEGQIVEYPSAAGACLVSFLQRQEGGSAISHVSCREGIAFPACQEFRKGVSRGWSSFFGTRCTSIAFIGNATCSCILDGGGCPQGDWPVGVER